MATFVDYDAQRKEYVLGPGLNSADEKHTNIAHNLNPTMELAYWKWALETAQQWRVRLGMLPDKQWQDVIDHMALPTVRSGIYPAMEIPVETSPSTMTTFMYGVLPGRGLEPRRYAQYASPRRSYGCSAKQCYVGYGDGRDVRGSPG